MNSLIEEQRILTKKKDKDGNFITRLIRKVTKTRTVCEVCKRPLKRSPGQIVRFCSDECRRKR